MIALKKVWVAFSILALGAFVVVPAVVAADTPSQFSTGNNSTQVSTGNNSSQTSSGNSQTQFSSGNSQTQFSTGNSSSGPGGLQNPLGNVTGICQLLKIVLNIAILTGIPVAMFFIVFAGFKLVLARGNSDQLNRAKQNLLWTVIGIAIFVGVWFIVQVIANTLGALGVQILGDCR